MHPYTYLNPSAALALYRALITEDPFYITLERCISPDPDTAREGMLKYMDYALREARDYGDLRLTRNQDQNQNLDQNHGQETGAAVWSIPQVPDRAAALSHEKKAFIAAHLGKEALDCYTEIVTFMAGQTKDLIPSTAWYLSILGVAPEFQGKGLGKALVAPVLDTTDALGVPAYIESFTPSNFGFYEHLGFKTVKTVFEPRTQNDYAIMLREPR